MKKLFLSSLIVLLIFFCTFSVNSQDKPKHFTIPYSGFQFYESPFNPNTTLRLWVFLDGFPLTPDIFYVVVGNPKLDWNKIKEYDKKKLENLNTDIYTVHYGFLVETDDKGEKHLTLFIYIWKNQKTGKTYKCIADPDDMTYKIKELKSDEDEKNGIKRFINDFNNLKVAWY